MEFRETMWAEMSPDMYAGPNCDQMLPRWYAAAAGGKGDGDRSTRPLELAPEHFPPGTRVLVLEPLCPKCSQVPELCKWDVSCDFDWDAWTADKYA